MDFQDGNCGGHLGHLGFPSVRISATFDLQVTVILQFLPNLKSIGMSVLEKKFNIDFQDGGYVEFPRWTILAVLIYKVPWYFLPKLELIGHLGFPIISFFNQQVHCNPNFLLSFESTGLFAVAVIVDLRSEMILAFFLFATLPDTSHQVSSQLAFFFREDIQNRFSRWPLLLWYILQSFELIFLSIQD